MPKSTHFASRWLLVRWERILDVLGVAPLWRPACNKCTKRRELISRSLLFEWISEKKKVRLPPNCRIVEITMIAKISSHLNLKFYFRCFVSFIFRSRQCRNFNKLFNFTTDEGVFTFARCFYNIDFLKDLFYRFWNVQHFL